MEQFRANFSDIFANLIDSKLTLHKAFSTKNVVTIEKFLDFDKITNLILTKNSTKKMSNPLAQAMILTSIVISLATFMIIISQWIH
ncbi:NADH-quinone oxidoreductase subunit K [Candidatus Gromoviella agglomerans]|uniref:NADH-quinone oxidoreductase subunit K n=1 Tax=Candidatus Gromoviella agglomerans TaxID=2806609 RepID=UPI001E54785A|nr:NADH-quinone oxidoreductase subunit K [Candidatus Gromoviella agglomerans]UFX98448.1 Putative monovalent cation/H+ antiporter subunit C [Candidatus Gromoviella agglomerans]